MQVMKIKVAEMFISHQFEGKSVGRLAVFLRLSNCTLKCSWCDSLEVWQQGTYYDLKELITIFKAAYVPYLDLGAHLILTGGSPLMQQGTLRVFLAELIPAMLGALWVEVETEGVLLPQSDFNRLVSWYNVSVKTANSGMPFNRRIVPDVINFHAQRSQDIFKFVVASPGDAEEVMSLVTAFKIPHERIYFMPLCNNRESQDKIGPLAVELAKQYKVNYSPRVHLQLYDKTTGV